MKLRWTRRARRDLSEIGRFIARDKPEAARRWVGRLQRKAQEAITAPKIGRRVPELERDDVRELLLRSGELSIASVRARFGFSPSSKAIGNSQPMCLKICKRSKTSDRHHLYRQGFFASVE